MLNRVALMEHSRDLRKDRDLDKPYYLNGFTGTFDFSDHNLVPELIRNLVMMETKYERFRQVPLEEINAIARDVHGGEPGVETRIYDRMIELQRQRDKGLDATSDKHTYTPELTIDDWNAQDDKQELDAG